MQLCAPVDFSSQMMTMMMDKGNDCIRNKQMITIRSMDTYMDRIKKKREMSTYKIIAYINLYTLSLRNLPTYTYTNTTLKDKERIITMKQRQESH